MAHKTTDISENAAEPTSNDIGRLTVDEDASSSRHRIDVVAVHGIHGNSRDTWKSEMAYSEKTWLTEAIFDKLPPHTGVRILKYSYITDERNGSAIYTKQSIRAHAVQLIKGLSKLREYEKLPRPIVFVAKDVGGIIIKDALFLASLNPTRIDNIIRPTAAMIFLQCPHRCSKPRDLEDEFVRLILADGRGYHREIIEKAQSLASYVIDVNNRFIDTNLYAKVPVFNVVSTAGDFSQRIFNRYTTTLQIPFEVVVETGRSHNDLTKAPVDPNYERGIVVILYRILRLYLIDKRPGNFQVRGITPLRPIGSDDRFQDRVKWIGQNEIYLKWKAETKASILHIYGPWGISAASGYIFDQLKNEGALLYYDFKPQDSRYHNIQAMLNTFINQFSTHYHTDIDMAKTRTFRFLQHYRACTIEDLYSFWVELLHCKKGGAITYIINGFDRCIDSSNWFIKKLFVTVDEWEKPFKFVFTNMAHNPERQEALADVVLSIDLNNPPELHGIHEHTDHPVVDSRQIGSFSSDRTLQVEEMNVNRILVACGSDECLKRLVLDWIESRYDINENQLLDPAFNSHGEHLTINKVLNEVLSCVPVDMRCLIHQAIAWTSSSFRPMTSAEFNIILALAEMEKRPQDFYVALQKMAFNGCSIPRFLVGLFILEDNEVRFSHPSAPELLVGEKALPGNDFLFEGKGAAHEIIATSCLSYLSLRITQTRMTMFFELEDQTKKDLLEPEDYSLLQYAVLYWGQHYKHATVSARLSDKAIKFLDSDARQCWAKAYHALTNCITRNDLPLSSALEVASEFGLEDLMTHFAKNMKEDYSMALIAAVKNNHAEKALKCFEDIFLTESLAHSVIMAAASDNNESLVLDLMNYFSSRISETIEWPTDLLARAAWLGWNAVVIELIGSGAHIDQLHDLYGMAPLHLAAGNNQRDTVRALLHAKAEINVRNVDKATPLHMASLYGHHEIVELLTHSGADLEAKQNDDQTALGVACVSGHGKVIKFLIRASSQTLSQNPEFSGKLFTKAVQRGSFTACQALLEVLPKLLDHYADDCPVLVRATATNKVALVELLASYGAAVDARWATDLEEGTALYYASKRGSKPMVECLLQLGADPKLSFYEGLTPIFIASKHRHTEVVQLLVNNEVDVNALTTDKWGPLQIAYRSAPIIRILLKANAEIDYVSQSGTALSLASRYNYIEVVKILLECGAGVDIPTPESRWSYSDTPLIIASDGGNAEIVKLLLEAGANTNYRNALTNFALQCAVQNEECMKALLEYGPLLDIVDRNGDTALHCVEERTPVSAVKRLMNAGANPEIVNNNGFTPVSMSILRSNLRVMKYFISKQVKLDIISGTDGGPLHLACMESLEYVKPLIDAGANVNLCDIECAGTPLHMLCLRRIYSPDQEEEMKQIIQLLIEAGAEVNKKGGKCGYPLHAACLVRAPDTIRFLLDKGAEASTEDIMQWNPAQLVSLRTTEHMNIFDIEEYRSLFSKRDALGRTALHYAVVSGRLDLVKRVYELSGKEANQKDNDGWTPLMWAVRFCVRWSTSTDQRADIIQFLKDEGADLWARGEGLLGRGWSPLKVARYYGVPPDIIEMLVPDIKERSINNGEERETYFHQTNLGIEAPGYCDGCLMGLWGIFFHCLQCRDYDLCFKCYRTVKDIHYSTHYFQEKGEVKDIESDRSEGEEDDEDSFQEGEEDEGDASKQAVADGTEVANI